MLYSQETNDRPYKPLPPNQSPIDPPYQTACQLKKNAPPNMASSQSAVMDSTTGSTVVDSQADSLTGSTMVDSQADSITGSTMVDSRTDTNSSGSDKATTI